MKNPYEIFEIDKEFDLDYLINKYEELISNCNDKKEMEEIQNAYEELLEILNKNKNHISDYKNCNNCNSKLNKNDIYCYKCGKNQHVKAKELNIKVKKVIITIVALIVVFQILNFMGFTDSIGFGNSFARSPKEAVYNNFKSVDTNDIKMYISSMDYKGIYDDLNYYCKSKRINLNKFIETGDMLLSESDAYMDEELGDGWSKSLKITQPRDIKRASVVEVTVYINGQNVLIPTIKVPNRGWFVYEESSDGFKDSYYDDLDRILYNDEIYVKELEENTDVIYNEVIDPYVIG